MPQISRGRGFTIVEIVVLLVIAIVLSGVTIPKMINASHMRKCDEFPAILIRIFDAQWEYKKNNETFADKLGDLVIEPPIPASRWFEYTIAYATADSFFAKAVVKKPFGKATTNDWAGINSSKARSISNMKTLGRYDVEWMRKKRKR